MRSQSRTAVLNSLVKRGLLETELDFRYGGIDHYYWLTDAGVQQKPEPRTVLRLVSS